MLGFAAALALTARAARADGDQSDIISAHGDARARATSAEELVKPMPAVPPNSAPPVIPSATAAFTTPRVARPAAVQTAPAGAAQIPPATAAQGETSAVLVSTKAAAPETGLGKNRGLLIAAGALIALAMFLWERRRKD